MVKAVIFDLDGTLYDNTTLPRRIILRSLFSLRMLYAERMCRHHMSGRYYGGKGATYRELFKRMGEMTGRTEDAAAAWYWGRYMPLQVKVLQKHMHVKPWVKPAIGMLRGKGIKVACFSEYGFMREKLKALDIDPACFDYLVDVPTAGGCKPCRKAFIYLAEKLGVNPEDILMVGDREDTDGAGAESCGMKFQLVPKCDTPAVELNLE